MSFKPVPGFPFNLSGMSKNLSALWLAVALVFLLGACGQKGPLYLPDREPAPAQKQKS